MVASSPSNFVLSPTSHWLRQELKSCQERLLVSSPFVNDFLVEATSNLASIKKTLLTRINVRDFVRGASSINALCTLADFGTRILSEHKLHAKAYVVDDRVALITSANATRSGMHRNIEFGIALSETSEVSAVTRLILNGFNSATEPQSWTPGELRGLCHPVEELRSRIDQRYFEDLLVSSSKLKLLPNSSAAVLESFGGWLPLTLEGIMDAGEDKFSLQMIYRRCLPLAAKRFPSNKNPKAKLRQQLQKLRDLGLVRFLGEGNYQRMLDAGD